MTKGKRKLCSSEDKAKFQAELRKTEEELARHELELSELEKKRKTHPVHLRIDKLKGRISFLRDERYELVQLIAGADNLRKFEENLFNSLFRNEEESDD